MEYSLENGEMADFKFNLSDSLRKVVDVGMEHLLKQTQSETTSKEAKKIVLFANGLGTDISFYLSEKMKKNGRFQVVKHFGESYFTHSMCTY